MTPLPVWLRRALLTTAAMNLLVGLAFASGSEAILEAAGFPHPVDAFYALTVGLLVALFGVGYGCAAVARRTERMFVTLAGFGKLAFVTLVVSLWVAGRLPTRAPIAASPDLIFGMLFLGWTFASREAPSQDN
nr:hypothetical protein Hi04_10k_c1000_00012 [uncultured bacterium]